MAERRHQAVRTRMAGRRWEEDTLLLLLLLGQHRPALLFLLRRKHLAPYPLLHRPPRYLDLDPISRPVVVVAVDWVTMQPAGGEVYSSADDHSYVYQASVTGNDCLFAYPPSNDHLVDVGNLVLLFLYQCV